MKANMKDTLLESTLLALQGKLSLTETKEHPTIKTRKVVKENLEINVEEGEVKVNTDEEAEVTSTPDATYIETETTEVIVQKTETPVESFEEPIEDIEMEDTVEEEVIEDEVEEQGEEEVEEEVESTEEVEDTDTEIPEETEVIEVPIEGDETIVPEEDILESKQLKTESESINYHNIIFDMIEDGSVDTNKLADQLARFISEEDMKRFCEIYEYIPLEDEEMEECKNKEKENKEDEDEKITKFNSKSFNEAITKMYKNTNKKIESFKVTKVLYGKNKLQVEGKLKASNNIIKNVTLNFNMSKQLKENFFKYESKNFTGLLKENKESTLRMLTTVDKNNVLQCVYVIKR